MKNIKSNVGSFAIAKLQAKMRSILALVAIISFSFALSLTSCSNGSTDNGTPTNPDDGKILDSIEVTTPPNKTRYNIGETVLVTTGMVVTAKYTDGTTEAVTGYTVGDEFDSSTTGIKEITVTYQGKTAKFSVNVIDPTLPTVATPTASPAGGTVASGTLVTLSTATEGAEIWYTTNGTIPAKNGSDSTKYTTPFAVTPPVTIKAVAFKDGMNNSGELTAEFPATHISVADINIDAPTKGAVPATAVSNPEQDRFTAGTVIWSPNDNPFKGKTEYTATVTLTAKSGFTFSNLTESAAKINGASASISNNTGLTVTLSHKFEETGEKAVSGIAIETLPTNPIPAYTHGDTLNLNLSGLKVKLTYDDGTKLEEITVSDFAANGITIVPSNGIPLERTAYNNEPVTINCAGFTVSIGNLTVNQKSFSDTANVTIEGITDRTYDNGNEITHTITVKHHVTNTTRELTLGKDYTVEYSNNTNVGTATVTITGIGDYTGSRTVTFTINAAIPQGGAPQITTTALPHGTGDRAYSQTLTATGDTPITWSIEGTLPDGLSLNGTTGIISGTPFNRTSIWSEDTYRYTFTVKATNSAGSAEKQLSIIIARTYTYVGGLLNNIQTYAANTADNPYLVALKVTDMTRFYNSSLDGKFVSLDLSESTYNSNTIPNNAFSSCTNIVNIILPNSVTSIGNQAFLSCTNLTNITIPNSVTSIDVNNVFLLCSSLTAINVDAGNNAYSSQDGVLYNKAKTVLVEYPEGKTDPTFTIPDSVTTLLKGYLGSNTRLTAINVNAGNSAYSSQDGVLYDKAKTTLIEYPMGKTDNSFIIPNGVTNIDESAIYNIGSLTSVTIPDSVTIIGNSAFTGCTSLTSITFATGSNIPDANFGNNVSPEGSAGTGGNTLKTAYNAASPKEGTYTREANGSTWSKQP